jgi:hypothetical protein
MSSEAPRALTKHSGLLHLPYLDALAEVHACHSYLHPPGFSCGCDDWSHTFHCTIYQRCGHFPEEVQLYHIHGARCLLGGRLAAWKQKSSANNVCPQIDTVNMVALCLYLRRRKTMFTKCISLLLESSTTVLTAPRGLLIS